MKTLGTGVIVSEIKESEVGGIILPESVAQTPKKGKVIAIGEGQYNPAGILIPLEVEVNDQILFPNFVGTKFQVNGTEYIHMKENEIIVILNKTRE